MKNVKIHHPSNNLHIIMSEICQRTIYQSLSHTNTQFNAKDNKITDDRKACFEVNRTMCEFGT